MYHEIVVGLAHNARAPCLAPPATPLAMRDFVVFRVHRNAFVYIHAGSGRRERSVPIKVCAPRWYQILVDRLPTEHEHRGRATGSACGISAGALVWRAQPLRRSVAPALPAPLRGLGHGRTRFGARIGPPHRT